jgi:hypothetical protein
MPGPALAERRVAKQPVDHPLVGQTAVVGEEIVKLLRGRRQTGQVKRDPPQPAPAVGVRSGLQVVRLKLRQNEPVQR